MKLNRPINRLDDRHSLATPIGAQTVDFNLEDLHILVADDDPRVLRLLERLLRSKGARVTCAGSGAEAMRILGREAIDLLLCDIYMPDGDGLETIVFARRHSPDLAIAVMTGGCSLFNGYDSLDVASLLGARLAIHKPFDAPSLLLQLRKLCPPQAQPWQQTAAGSLPPNPHQEPQDTDS